MTCSVRFEFRARVSQDLARRKAPLLPGGSRNVTSSVLRAISSEQGASSENPALRGSAASCDLCHGRSATRVPGSTPWREGIAGAAGTGLALAARAAETATPTLAAELPAEAAEGQGEEDGPQVPVLHMPVLPTPQA